MKETWEQPRDNSWLIPDRYLPDRATVMGETLRLLGERIYIQYKLSVTAAWPRIWLLTSNDIRTLIGNAYQRYSADAMLTAWGLLYLPWTLRWWPAIIIAAAAIAAGHRRARSSSRALATLIEAAVDAHVGDLANALGVDLPQGRVTTEEGNQINNILLKRACIPSRRSAGTALSSASDRDPASVKDSRT